MDKGEHCAEIVSVEGADHRINPALRDSEEDGEAGREDMG